MFLSCLRTHFTEAGHSQARQESRPPLVAKLEARAQPRHRPRGYGGENAAGWKAHREDAGTSGKADW